MDRLRMDKRVTMYVLLSFIRDQGINMRVKWRKGKIKRINVHVNKEGEK